MFIEWGIKLYYSKIISLFLRNSLYWLRKELKTCHTVLDLGCGKDSLLLYQPVKFSVGVDYFFSSLEKSKNKKIHHFYIQADIRNIEFKPNSFDAVLLLNVIEHLKKEEALKVLKKAVTIAAKKVIITTPNGYLKQILNCPNPLQLHHSGWQVEELTALGFRAKGLSGFKFFRNNFHCEDASDYLKRTLSTIRFRPRILWLLLAELSQIFACYFPQYAFEVFYVKTRD